MKKWIKSIINKIKLWKYERNAKYYDDITGGQSTYYHNKIKELKNK